MNKKLIFTLCIILVAILSLGGVAAYIAIKVGPIVNTFDAGQIRTEVLSSTEENATVFTAQSTNQSDTDAYVRFTVVATWVTTEAETGSNTSIAAKTPILGTDYTLTLAEGVAKFGDFYYVTSPVAKNSSASLITATLENRAEIPEGYQLKIEVLTDAIQYRPENAVTDAWGVVLTDGVISGLEP